MRCSGKSPRTISNLSIALQTSILLLESEKIAPKYRIITLTNYSFTKGLITSKMTFPDVVEETVQKNDLDTMSMKTAEFLKEALLKAMSVGRLTSGVFECAKVFRIDPDKVRLCILPVTSSTDVSVHIQHKLIEAYCWENEIQLLKVDSAEKLSAILNFGDKKHQKSKNAMPVTTASVDCSCVLVTYPPKDKRDEDDESYAFMEHVWPHQVIELPPD